MKFRPIRCSASNHRVKKVLEIKIVALKELKVIFRSIFMNLENELWWAVT